MNILREIGGQQIEESKGKSVLENMIRINILKLMNKTEILARIISIVGALRMCGYLQTYRCRHRLFANAGAARVCETLTVVK